MLKYILIHFYDYKYEHMCNKILEELNYIFLRVFNYNEYILKGYNDMLETKELCRACVPNKDFKVLDKGLKDGYIRKLSKIS